MKQLRDMILLRIEEPPVISAISSILEQPSKSLDNLELLSFVKDCLPEISEDQLLPYRPALVALSQIDKNKGSDTKWTWYLAH